MLKTSFLRKAYKHITRLPRWHSGEEFAYNTGDVGDVSSIPGSERSLGGRNGNLLQYSCLGNPMERGAYSPWDRKESDTTEQLNNNNNPIICTLMTLRYQGWERGGKEVCATQCYLS